MTTSKEMEFIGICFEGFFYGKISVPCALTCSTLAEEVQLFLGLLGLYSGIFAMYLYCLSKSDRDKSKTAILFYALCFLYVLSTATIVGDLTGVVLQVGDNLICKNTIS